MRMVLQKLSSVGLSIAILASVAVLPVHSEETVGVNTSLFVEDFENITGINADGTIPVNLGTKTKIGNLALTLREGDTAKIKEETNGNHYLEITRGNNSGSHTSVEYTFPEIYDEGKIRVSYDFMPEVSSKYFNNFGSLIDSTTGNLEDRIQALTTYGDTMFISNGITWSGGMYKGGVMTSRNNYITISQTLDCETTTNNYNLSLYVNNEGQNNPFSSANLSKNHNAVTGIRWEMVKNVNGVGYNGPDGNTTETENTPGVYRIDNILVENVTDITTADKVCEDFENQPINKELTNTKGWLGLGNIVAQNGDKISIAKDPITNSKALRIEKGSTSADETYFEWDFGDIEGEKVKVSYDLRFENHSAFLEQFPKLSNVAHWGFYQEDLYWNCNTGNIVDSSWKKYFTDRTKYQTVSFEYDPSTGITAQMGGKTFTRAASGTTVSSLKFGAKYPTSGDYNGWKGQDGGNGIYWIDNLSVEVVPPEAVIVTDIEQNGNQFIVKFNSEIADDDITKENFTVTKDGMIITDYSVAKSTDDVKNIVIALDGLVDYDKTYIITAKAGVTGSGYLPLSADFSKSFIIKSETVIIDEDFNDYNTGAGLSSLNIGNITVQDGKSGDGVTIEADGENNKAVKITQNIGSTEYTGFKVDLQNYTSGTVKMNFKIKTNAKNAHMFYEWVSGSAGEWGTAVMDMVQFETGIYTNNNLATWVAGFDENKYTDFTIVVDLDNKTVMFNNKKTARIPTKVTSLNFLISSNVRSPGKMLTDETTAPIYWIDDVSAVHYTYPEIIASSVRSGATQKLTDKVYTFTYNKAIDEETLAGNVIVKKDGDLLLENTDYTVSYADKVVTVTLANDLTYDSEYAITLGNGICSTDGEKCKDSKTYNFKAESNPDAIIGIEVVNANGVEVSDLTEYKGESIKVKANVNSKFEDYTFFAVLKDKDGKLISIDMINKADAENNLAIAELLVPSDATDEYYIEGFLWDMSTQAPLDEKLDILKKKQ